MKRAAMIGAAGAVLAAGLFGVAAAQNAGSGTVTTAISRSTNPQPVTMAQRPNATGGEALYVEHCVMCHGPNGMGTGLLGRKMDTPILEARDNLPAQYVVQAARRGIGNMPAIPRGELSDADLQAIADYIAAGPHPHALGEAQ